MKVLAFVGTRADLFPLGPVLCALEDLHEIDLHVATAIGFDKGVSESLLIGAGLRPGHFVHHDLGLHSGSFTPQEQVQLGSQLSLAILSVLDAVHPDAAVVLGDRWELLYVAPPLVLMGVPLIHLHGGEVTEGALDERVRHALTKLADQHCVSTQGAYQRVRQLGEDPQRIHRTGAPGLDRFRSSSPMSGEDFESEFGVPLRRPLIVGTYHPVTAGGSEAPGLLARRVFEAALDVAGTLILTHPGFDVGREEIVAALDELERRELPHVVIRPGLGAIYPSIMATADLMIGNSSSGIIEAASFGLPAVDVGERQRGREHGANVLHCGDDSADLLSSLHHALSPEFRELARGVENPYGDGLAAEKIAGVVAEARAGQPSKRFIDASLEGVPSGS